MTANAPVALHHEPARESASSTSRREVIGAWIVLVLLLAGMTVSFALDHMVTVSDRTDWSSLVPPAAAPADDEEDGVSVRELRDSDRR